MSRKSYNSNMSSLSRQEYASNRATDLKVNVQLGTDAPGYQTSTNQAFKKTHSEMKNDAK